MKYVYVIVYCVLIKTFSIDNPGQFDIYRNCDKKEVYFHKIHAEKRVAELREQKRTFTDFITYDSIKIDSMAFDSSVSDKSIMIILKK